MSYHDIELAKMRVAEALKMGLESQRGYRERESKGVRRAKNLLILRTMILSLKCSILEYRDRIYCRMHGILHFRPACP